MPQNSNYVIVVRHSRGKSNVKRKRPYKEKVKNIWKYYIGTTLYGPSKNFQYTKHNNKIKVKILKKHPQMVVQNPIGFS